MDADAATVTIEEATERLIDYRGKTPPKVQAGVRLITAKVIKGGQILDEPAEFIAEDFYDEWMRRGLPKRFDVLITTEAPLGEVAILKTEAKVALAQRVILLRAKAGLVDPGFLFYALQSEFAQGELRARGSGTTVLGIKQTELRRVRIPYRTMVEQRRIAGILSAYDDLIENCQRRIRILEDMARGLYREWFVHYRFPGHERVRMVESQLGSVPEEWSIAVLEDVTETVGGGTPSKTESEYWDGGEINWYSPTDLTGAKTVFMEASASKITQLGLAKSSAKLFPANSVMMTSRATLGVIAVNTTPACTNQGFIVCVPSERMPLWLLFHWLKANETEFEALATGATFKEITKGVFRKVNLVVPATAAAAAFEDMVRPMMDLVLRLERKNRNLRATRDLLLPRLMSGQLRVGAAAEQLQDDTRPTYDATVPQPEAA